MSKDSHEALVEKVAQAIFDAYAPRRTVGEQIDAYARAVIALIAEETKLADAQGCIDVDRRMDGVWTPEIVWSMLHRASALWPKEAAQ